MKKPSEHFQCENCDGITETIYVSYTFERFGKKFRYDHIKAEVCPKCGERYLDGPSVTKIEADIKSRMSIAD